MGSRRLFISFIFAIACLAYVFYIDIPQEKNKIDSQKFLTKSESRNCTKVISIREGETTSILKKQGNWEIEGLEGIPVDSEVMRELLSEASDFSIKDLIPESEIEKLENFGLKDPALSTTFTCDSRTKKIAFGKENAYLSKRYVLVGETKLLLGGESLFNALNLSQEGFRERDLFSFNQDKIKSIKISAAENFTLEKNKENWELITTEHRKASLFAVNDFLTQLSNIKVDIFGEQVSLPQEVIRFEIRFDKKFKKDPIVVNFWERIGGNKSRYTLFQIDGIPALHRVDRPLLNSLASSSFSYREKKLLKDLYSPEISKLVLKSGNNEINIERDSKGQWLVNTVTGDDVFIEDLIANLSSLEVNKFVPEGGLESKGEERSIQIVTKDGAEATLHFSPVGDLWKVSGGALEDDALIGSDQIKGIFPNAETLQKQI